MYQQIAYSAGYHRGERYREIDDFLNRLREFYEFDIKGFTQTVRPDSYILLLWVPLGPIPSSEIRNHSFLDDGGNW